MNDTRRDPMVLLIGPSCIAALFFTAALVFSASLNAQEATVGAGTDDAVLGMTWIAEATGPVTVATVEEGSAAAAAGLRKGDVIRTINKAPVTAAGDLAKTLNNLRAGEKITIGIQRGGRALQTTIAGPQDVAVPTRVGLLGALLKLDAKGRIAVTEVSPGTPAEVAGLAPGDVLISVGGFEPTTVDDLVDYTTRLVTGRRSSDELQMTVLRKDEEQELTIMLPEPGTPGAPMPRGQAAGTQTVVLGVEVAETENGLVVTGVLRGGPATQAGIRQGDAILAVNEQKTPTFAQLAEAVQGARPGQKVPVDVLREGKAFIANTTAMSTQSRAPDVALNTGASDLGAPAVELQAQVEELQARVDQLTAIVEQLSKEIAVLKQRAR